jgi:hypothetical protein
MTKESDVLNEKFRKKVIEEINSQENIARKKEAWKRYEIYKDQTRKYIEESLRQEFDNETVDEMMCRISNISILKKIVDKKAMVYKNAPKRQLLIKDDNNKLSSQLTSIVSDYSLNTVMKRCDKMLEYQNNAFIFPSPYIDMVTGKWDLVLKVLQPFSYDIIEDKDNNEIPRCLILSDFMKSEYEIKYKEVGQSGVRDSGEYTKRSALTGDGRNQIIADTPFDSDNENFIWWTTNYHFTTDKEGVLIPDKNNPENENIIKAFPGIDFADDRDGSYWAIGKNDLVDGCILVNAIITDMLHIAKTQGLGMFYFFGKGIPKTITVGPNKAITHEVKEGDPTPQIGFANSNPPIGDWLKIVEQTLALLLSTNSLEPDMTRASNGLMKGASSGVQEMIRMSDLIDDLEDRKEAYIRKEPKVVELLAKWHNVLINSASGASEKITFIGEINEEIYNYLLLFGLVKKFTTEKEELEIIETRRKLLLDSYVDSIMRDNPDLSRDEAEKKLQDNLIKKLEMVKHQTEMFIKNEGNNESNQENQTANAGDE